MGSSCATKTVYLSRNAAKKAGKRAIPRLYFYECPDCGNYHLTKIRPGRFEQRERVRNLVVRCRHLEW